MSSAEAGAAARPPVTVTVRGVELGRGRPEIIVPIVGEDLDAVLAQTRAALAGPGRIVEWRVDRFHPELASPSAHREAALAALPSLRAELGADRALLVTARTAAEGGSRAFDDGDLAALLEGLLTPRQPGVQSPVDLVDIEMERDPAVVASIVRTARRSGVAVVGSFHDFDGTPAEEELVRRLRAHRRAGADIPKIAVTPRDAADVLALLRASVRVAADGTGPLIAISMGSLGAVSRVAGEIFGSAATFAAAGEGSAPGQLSVEDVAATQQLLRP